MGNKKISEYILIVICVAVITEKCTWDGPDVDHVVDGSGDQFPRIVPRDMLEHLALQIHLTRLITVVENARVLKKQDRPPAETPDPNGTVVATEKQRHYNFWEINTKIISVYRCSDCTKWGGGSGCTYPKIYMVRVLGCGGQMMFISRSGGTAQEVGSQTPGTSTIRALVCIFIMGRSWTNYTGKWVRAE